MKVLLVDDEAIIRAGMRALVPWEANGYTLVGEAMDAIQGLEMAGSLKPDIMLIDIGMPGKDGLQLIAEVQCILPNCRFIILSCRDDVACFTKAIRLGVKEYILKNTIRPDELLAVLDRISSEIRKERVFEDAEDPGNEHINRNVVLSEFLGQTIQGMILSERTIRSKLASHWPEASNGSYRFVTIRIRPSGNKFQTVGDAVLRSLLQLSQQILQAVGQGLAFFSHESKPTLLLVGLDPDNDPTFEICRRILETALQMLDLAPCFGLSRLLEDVTNMPRAYRESVLAADRFFFNEKGYLHVFRVGIPTPETLSGLERRALSLVNGFRDASDKGITQPGLNLADYIHGAIFQDSEPVRRCYRHLLHQADILSRQDFSSPVPVPQTEQRAISPAGSSSGNLSLQHDTHSDVIEEVVTGSADFETMHNAAILLLERMSAMKVSSHDEDGPEIVHRIRRFIGRNLYERIHLADIASEVHLSTDYAGRLFRRETGQTLAGYLLEMRIERAKAMLRSGRGLKDIAHELRFSSESHLIRTFRRQTGMTPGKYLHGHPVSDSDLVRNAGRAGRNAEMTGWNAEMTRRNDEMTGWNDDGNGRDSDRNGRDSAIGIHLSDRVIPDTTE